MIELTGFPEEVQRSFDRISQADFHQDPGLDPSMSEFEFKQLLESGSQDVIPLKFNVPYLEILEEISRCQQYLVDHKPLDETFYEWRRRTGLPEGHWKIAPTKSGAWKAMCLFGLEARRTKEASFYTDWQQVHSKPPVAWTEIAEHCPIAVAFFKSLPIREISRIRFSRLGSKGYIAPHRDAGEAKYFLNIALNMPEGCYFKLNNRLIPFKSGSAFLINVSKTHELVNFSAEDRIHMIVNCDDPHRLVGYL